MPLLGFRPGWNNRSERQGAIREVPGARNPA